MDASLMCHVGQTKDGQVFVHANVPIGAMRLLLLAPLIPKARKRQKAQSRTRKGVHQYFPIGWFGHGAAQRLAPFGQLSLP